MSDYQKDHPISLEHMQPILDRVHERYPMLTKYEIVLITKTFLTVMREILLSGGILSLNNFFSHMHLISFNKIRKNKFSRIVKVKLSTSRKIKDG